MQLPTLTTDCGLSRYLKEVNAFPSLSAEEEFLLAKAYLEEHDLEAAHRLVTSHLKLVVKIALSFKNYGLPVMDLISEGSLGLMHAVKKFNPDLGYRLSTYAMWWIRASIQEYVLRSWSLVKLGTTSVQKKLFFSLAKIKRKIRNIHCREVNSSDYQQIAYELGTGVDEVSEMNARLTNVDVSLNKHIGHEADGAELIDMIPDSSVSQEVTTISKQEGQQRQQMLHEAISQLNERERFVIEARRLREDSMTLEDLSHILRVSKERIRQIEARAIEKMQEYIKGLMPHLA